MIPSLKPLPALRSGFQGFVSLFRPPPPSKEKEGYISLRSSHSKPAIFTIGGQWPKKADAIRRRRPCVLRIRGRRGRAAASSSTSTTATASSSPGSPPPRSFFFLDSGSYIFWKVEDSHMIEFSFFFTSSSLQDFEDWEQEVLLEPLDRLPLWFVVPCRHRPQRSPSDAHRFFLCSVPRSPFS